MSYPDIALICDGKPVVIEAGVDQGFRITPQQLEAAITSHASYSSSTVEQSTWRGVFRGQLKALGAVLRRHPQVLIATDDMYEHQARRLRLRQHRERVRICTIAPSSSTAYQGLFDDRMAHRLLRWPAGDHHRHGKHPVAIDVNPTSISQVAAEAALNGDQACIAPMVKAFRERHAYVVGALNAMPGVKCLYAGGSFYAFPYVGEAIRKMHAKGLIASPTDLAFSAYLLEEALVAVVPGSAFGSEGYLRISFATSMANLEKAMTRMNAALTDKISLDSTQSDAMERIARV